MGIFWFVLSDICILKYRPHELDIEFMQRFFNTFCAPKYIIAMRMITPIPVRLGLLCSLLAFLFTGCLQYPLGNSRGGQYFGGYGLANRPSSYVPPKVARNNDMTLHP